MHIEVKPTGVRAEAVQHFRAEIPYTPGQHLWIVAGVWRVNPATVAKGERVELDMENLLTIDGPGCYWCEQQYSPEVAAKPCKPALGPGS